MAGPGQANIGKGRVGRRELGIAVGRQINGGEALVIQGEREGQRNGGYRIIPVIADVHTARNYRTGALNYADLAR